jgi:uncharacterized protein YoxC
MSIEEKLSEELDELKRIRDEIRVQIRLGKAEAKDLWERSEEKIGELESKVKSISNQAEQPLHDIGDAAKLLVDEIREGFKRIRDAI